MKTTIIAQDFDSAKEILEEAMLKALQKLSAKADELSFFCTIEEQNANFRDAKAA